MKGLKSKKPKEKHLTTTQMIILGFLAVIIIGTCLLCLPKASNDGTTSFIDALFTATTSVCVTGLVTVTTASHWTLFGHIIILLLIQVGGMGVVAISTTVMMLLHRKLSLSNRMLLEDAFNMNTLSGLIRFLRKVFIGTVIIEGIGMLCYLPVFVKEFGAKGIWYSLFHSVSAFCNAGIDLLGEDSLIPYVHNIWINIVTMALIIMGGLGFIVWFDVIDVIKRRARQKQTGLCFFQQLCLHTKIVLCMTFFLIVTGTILFFIFEYDNPKTIGTFTLPEKLLACLFQSVTTRTAGFATISQAGLTVSSVFICLLLMFIGGSPVGTAGGVKTTTVAIILLTVRSTAKGQNDITCFNRRISNKTARKSLAVIFISLIACITAIILLEIFETGDTINKIFEVVSALGTVGLTRDYTPAIGLFGKVLLCICMYAGRVGPISMVIAFTVKNQYEPAIMPEENVTVG